MSLRFRKTGIVCNDASVHEMYAYYLLRHSPGTLTLHHQLFTAHFLTGAVDVNKVNAIGDAGQIHLMLRSGSNLAEDDLACEAEDFYIMEL